MTFEDIRSNEEVRALLARGNQNLDVLGFTDHSVAHCALVADRAAYILRKLGYSDHDEELARIAGFMHDIGNTINRTHHAEIGALLANDILKQTDIIINTLSLRRNTAFFEFFFRGDVHGFGAQSAATGEQRVG